MRMFAPKALSTASMLMHHHSNAVKLPMQSLRVVSALRALAPLWLDGSHTNMHTTTMDDLVLLLPGPRTSLPRRSTFPPPRHGTRPPHCLPCSECGTDWKNSRGCQKHAPARSKESHLPSLT
jgi:hypothetical protein